MSIAYDLSPIACAESALRNCLKKVVHPEGTRALASKIPFFADSFLAMPSLKLTPNSFEWHPLLRQ